MAGQRVRLTKDLFLWCMSVIYLFAFASLFVQIPGLYGDNGILPARLVVENEAESLQDLVTNQPSLLRLLPKVGLDIQTGMDFLSLGGVIVSFVAMVSHDYRNCVVFAVLWAFYLSLFQVGQTFICCQWDLLLLEAGFLAIIIAPLNFFGLHDIIDHHAHDRITLWLVKWLLFRLTFANGVVKLLSNSATWWSLTAMKHHYETQLLPTPIAYLFHQFPDCWHRLSTAAILIIQIPVALLFFSPAKKQRHFAFYSQFASMVLLVLTGNFGFFPLLVLTLCLSLVDDDFIEEWVHQSPKAEKDHPKESHKSSDRMRIFEKVFSIVTYGGLLFLIFYSLAFNIRTEPVSLEPEIAVTPEDLDWFLSYALPASMVIGAVSLTWEIGNTILKVLTNKRSKSKVKDLTGCAFFGLIALALFSVSLVPHDAIRKDDESYLPEALEDAYAWTSQNYRLTNPYNLFLKSNEEEDNGRLEIVFEGSNKLQGNWKEYHFRYKPDDVKSKLSIVAPHYPRLDSQMWFAARAHYDQNPWLLNLAFRLLRNQKEVLELMDDNPFPNKPPKYVRAILYRYRFASKSAKTDKFSASDWWVRESIREYMPPLTLDEPSFVNYLMDAGVYAEAEKLSDEEEERNLFYGVLEDIRSMLGQGSGNIVCVFLLVSGVILTLVDPCIKLPTEDEEEQLANGVNSHSLSNK
jgi:hypothetical protein